MKSMWVPRGHFHPCAGCGSTQTFRHIDRERIVDAVWCYSCGRRDGLVTTSGKVVAKKWTTMSGMKRSAPTFGGTRVDVTTGERQ